MKSVERQANRQIVILLMSIASSIWFYFILLVLDNKYQLPLPFYDSTGGSAANGNTVSDDIYKYAFVLLFSIFWYFNLYLLLKSAKKTISVFILSIPTFVLLAFFYALFSWDF